MQPTVRIKEATDGRITLRVEELPDLIVHVRTILEIPDAVGDAAGVFVETLWSFGGRGPLAVTDLFSDHSVWA